MLSKVGQSVTVLHLVMEEWWGFHFVVSAFQKETCWNLMDEASRSGASCVKLCFVKEDKDSNWEFCCLRDFSVIQIQRDTQWCSKTKTNAKQWGLCTGHWRWLHANLIRQRLLNLHSSWSKSHWTQCIVTKSRVKIAIYYFNHLLISLSTDFTDETKRFGRFVQHLA